MRINARMQNAECRMISGFGILFLFGMLHFYKIVTIFRKKEFTNRDFFDRIVRL